MNELEGDTVRGKESSTRVAKGLNLVNAPNWSCLKQSLNAKIIIYGLFGWRGEGRRVEGSRVEFTKNKLILC